MKVLYVVPSLDYKYGGPTQVIIGLTKALVQKGIKVSVFTSVGRNDDLCIDKLEGVDVKLFPKTFFSKFWTSYSPLLAKALMEEVFNFDLIHIHEIWHYPHFAAFKAAKFSKKKFIVTMHGGVNSLPLCQKAFRKKIYSFFIQKKILKEASVIQAVSENEIKEIYRFVRNENIFHLPNGVNLKTFENIPSKNTIEKSYPQLKNKKVILFLGRVYPKKGLDLLAKAFGVVLKKRNDVQLIIAGPNNNVHKKEIVKILKHEQALENSIFTGMLTGNNKLAVLSRADIFVLPSSFEGFSISVLEAMASKLPIVITSRCNFPEIEEVKAGVVIEPDVTQLVNSLVRLLDNLQLCKEMGKNGQQLISEKFTWDRIADRMIELYQDTLLRGENI
ncbi:glycosyltransferase [bacterium]|nr:glycosyltransferase [bacterium]